jgi:hypothetical protein
MHRPLELAHPRFGSLTHQGQTDSMAPSDEVQRNRYVDLYMIQDAYTEWRRSLTTRPGEPPDDTALLRMREDVMHSMRNEVQRPVPGLPMDIPKPPVNDETAHSYSRWLEGHLLKGGTLGHVSNNPTRTQLRIAPEDVVLSAQNSQNLLVPPGVQVTLPNKPGHSALWRLEDFTTTETTPSKQAQVFIDVAIPYGPSYRELTERIAFAREQATDFQMNGPAVQKRGPYNRKFGPNAPLPPVNDELLMRHAMHVTEIEALQTALDDRFDGQSLNDIKPRRGDRNPPRPSAELLSELEEHIHDAVVIRATVARTLAADITAKATLKDPEKRLRTEVLVGAWGQPPEPGDSEEWRTWSTLVTLAETSRLVDGVPIDEVRLPNGHLLTSFDYRSGAALDQARSEGLAELDPSQAIEEVFPLSAALDGPAQAETVQSSRATSGGLFRRRGRRAVTRATQDSPAPTADPTKAPDAPEPDQPRAVRDVRPKRTDRGIQF